MWVSYLLTSLLGKPTEQDFQNILLARTLSASGRQLFGIDQFQDTRRPLLELLGDPESIFVQGLARFARRTLYANIIRDKNAVFYTTWISKTDPFVPLDKKVLTYLKGYEDVILDPSAPIISRTLDTHNPTLYRLFTKGLSTLFPVPFHSIITVPLSSVLFLILSGYWSLRSKRRIRLYDRGLAGIRPGDYRVPLLNNANEDLHSSQDTAFATQKCKEDTATNSPILAHSNPSDQAEARGSAPGREESQKSHLSKDAFPILALAPYQFCIIDALDDLGWHKYAVHIQQLVNSHAAIIVRIQKPRYSDGYDVIRHWLEEEFIV